MLYTDEIVENTGDDLPIIASTRNGFRAKARESSSQRNGGKGPTADWVESFSSLSSTTLFLMARQGPTVFIVKNENDGIFKVVIGQPHQCSCGSSHHAEKKKRRSLPAIEEGNGEENNISERSTDASSRPPQQSSTNSGWCQHLLFCLIKVLKIPKEHPLCYKLSMTNSEIDQVLNGLTQYEARKIPKRAMRLKRYEAQNDAEDDSIVEETNPNYVQRQSISESADNSGDNAPDSCPICQDDMYKGQCLTWCRTGCGNNMHAKCMMQYCKFKMSSQQKPGCPLCRDDWNMDLLQQDCLAKEKKSSSSTAGSKGSSKSSQGKAVKHLLAINCSNCTCLLRNTFHRCIECSFRAYKSSLKTVDICGECFNRMSYGPTAAHGTHAVHHFLSSCNTALTNINEVHWTADQYPIHGTPRVSQQREATIASIQSTITNRELDVNDYDMLLNLDAGVQMHLPEISDLLVDALSIAKDDSSGSTAPTKRCWCDNIGHQGSHNIGKVRKMFCGHMCHDFCLRNELFELLSSADTSAFNGIPLTMMSCPHSECDQKVFPYLNRRKEASVAATDNNNNNVDMGAVGGKPDLGINIVGSNFSVAGHNIGNSSISSSGSTTANTLNVTNTSRSTGNLDSGMLGQGNRQRLSSISATGSRRLRVPNSRAVASNAEESDGCGLYVRGLHSNSNSNSIASSSNVNALDSSYHNSNNEMALPSLPTAQHILTNQRDPLRRPPRPIRVGLGPTRLQPISLGSGAQSISTDSIAENSFSPLISSSQINSKVSGKPSVPTRLPALSGRLSPIETSSSSSSLPSAQHVLRSPEKRIHYSNRNSSNLKKVGDVLVQRILHDDGEEGNSFVEDHPSKNNDVGLALNCIAYGKNAVDRKRSARHSTIQDESNNNNHYSNSSSGGGDGSGTTGNYSYSYDTSESAGTMIDSGEDNANSSRQYSTNSKAGKLRKGLSMQSGAKKPSTDLKSLSINGAT